jgi:hypothetical protein
MDRKKPPKKRPGFRWECLDALKAEIAQPFIDPGFDNAKPTGLCFQGVQK